MKPLLMNYRFSINIGDKKFVNLACLADILVADDRIKVMAPFPIQYVKYDNDIAKIAIVFTNKIRVYVVVRTSDLQFSDSSDISA